MYQRTLPKWRTLDARFIELHNFQSIFKKVKKQRFVTIIGSPGCGKSVTAHHIAFGLEKEGYEILQVTDIRDIVQTYSSKQKKVYVIDNFLGIFGLIKERLNQMVDNDDLFENEDEQNCKFIMTCREVIFNQTQDEEKDCFLIRSDNVINLHSDENALTYEDKIRLLKVYDIKLKLSREVLSKTWRIFPLLCYVYANDHDLKLYGQAFFEIPIKCILQQLGKLSEKEKLLYASLVLLASFRNKLTKEMLEDETLYCIKNDVLESCVKERPTNSSIINALMCMTGTYIKNINGVFSFVHDSMFEIVAYHFGCLCPELILKHMDSVYIANFIRPTTCDIQPEGALKNYGFDLCINLPERLYQKFAERIYKDIKNMNLFEVFSNNVIKHKQVCEQIINVLGSKSLDELYTLFFSEQTDISKIVRRKQKKENNIEKHKEYNIEIMLMHERELEHLPLKRMEVPTEEMIYVYSLKVVGWVIYYGHNRILQYILNRITKCRRNDNDLFDKTNSTVWENVHSLRLSERIRLFFLACCSGDVDTVNIMEKYVNKEMINKCPMSSGGENPRYLPLAAACYRGNVSIVKKLLKIGADKNLKCGLYETPLIAACKGGFIDLVSILINAGADLNLQGGYHTPLTAALADGHFSIVERLIQKGADINKNNCMFESPLTVACKIKNVNMDGIDLLLKHGAEVNPAVAYSTPLMYACENENIELVEKLLKRGASVNLKNTKESPLTSKLKQWDMSLSDDMLKLVQSSGYASLDFRDRYPLTLACKSGNVQVIKKLLSKKAYEGSVENLMKLICSVGDIGLLKEYSNLYKLEITPIHAACERGHGDVVFELLKAETRIDLKDNNNLELAIACRFGDIKMVKKCLETCTNSASMGINYIVLKLLCCIFKDVFGDVLQKACIEGHVFIVNTLLDLNVNANGGSGFYSGLTAACFSRQIDILKMLLDKGAEINKRWDKCTPLTVACQKGYCDVVEVLIGRNADVNLQDITDTPLTAACKAGHIDVVKKLIEKNANVNLRGALNTPLTSACQFGHEIIVRELIEAGAKVNLSGKFVTPLTAACCFGYLNIVNMLVENMADVNKLSVFDSSVYFQDMDPDTLIACRKNYPTKYCTPLTAASRNGHTSVVQSLLNGRARVDKTDGYETPLLAACRRGHVQVVKMLLEFGANINLRNVWGHTAVDEILLFMNDNRLQILKIFGDYNVDYSMYTEGLPHPLLVALIKHNSKVVNLVLRSGDKKRQTQMNMMLYKVLVDIRNGIVKSDCKDDVVLRKKTVWCLNKNGLVWSMISFNDSVLLQHLFHIGLNVNQKIKLYNKKIAFPIYPKSEAEVNSIRPLIFFIIDKAIFQRVEKVRTLLEAGVDLSIRVPFSNYCSLLDKDGVTVLERTRRLITSLSKINNKTCEKHVSDLKKVMREIKKRTRRLSV